MIPNSLSDLNATGRVLTASFLITLLLAYGVALLFIFVQTDMTPQGIDVLFRGGEYEQSLPDVESGSDEEISSFSSDWKVRHGGMKFAKPLREMILTTHLHMLSIGMILFIVGGIFSLSSFPQQIKKYVIVLAFASLIGDYASMWAVRYVSAGFSSMVFTFGFVQSGCMFLQIGWSLRDVVRPVLMVKKGE